jgi:hypothetical protein
MCHYVARRLVTCVILLGIQVVCAFGSTTLIRETAKNEGVVFFFYNSPVSERVANELREQILTDKNNKHKETEVLVLPVAKANNIVPPHECDKELAKEDKKACEELKKQYPRPAIFFVLAGDSGTQMGSDALIHVIEDHRDRKESKNPLDFDLRRALLAKPEDPIVRKAIYQCFRNRNARFTSVMYAPDDVALDRLAKVVMNQSASEWQDLVQIEKNEINYLANFSPVQDRETVQNWGATVGGGWDFIKWYDIAERSSVSDQELRLYDEAYFIPREDKQIEIPQVPAEILEETTKEENAIVAARIGRPNGTRAAVISAPSRLILNRRVLAYRNIDSIPVPPRIDKVVDLRYLNPTVFIVAADDIQVPVSSRRNIVAEISKDIRQQLSLDVEPRGRMATELDREIAFSELKGVPKESLKLALKQYRIRYLFVFETLEYRGRTEYSPSASKITPNPPSVSHPGPEPVRERVVKKEKESYSDYQKRLNRADQEYQTNLYRWRANRDQYQEYLQQIQNATVSWERWINRHETGSIRGILHVLDMDKPVDKTVWQCMVSGDASHTSQETRDRTTVIGYDAQPPSLHPPTSRDDCSAGWKERATTEAIKKALVTLQGEVWLPTKGAWVQHEPPPSVVMGVTGKIVKISLDYNKEPRIGGKVAVELPTQPPKWVNMEIQSFGPDWAKCIAVADSQSPARIPLLKQGMVVRWK